MLLRQVLLEGATPPSLVAHTQQVYRSPGEREREAEVVELFGVWTSESPTPEREGSQERV